VVSDRDDAIDALVPNEGADVLRQSTVGIDLADGYLAQIAVNGITIPDDQLSGDRGLAQYFFSPGPGRVLESLQPVVRTASWPPTGVPPRARSARRPSAGASQRPEPSAAGSVATTSPVASRCSKPGLVEDRHPELGGLGELRRARALAHHHRRGLLRHAARALAAPGW
jgi:hypothetical protein